MRRLIAAAQLAVATLILAFIAPAPSFASGGNLWHSSPDTGYAEPFHVYCQNTGMKLIYAGQGANGPACEAFLQVQVVDGQEIWCYQSYQWTKWLDATGFYSVSGSRSCESRAD